MMVCPWCKYKQGGKCEVDENEKDFGECDFKKLDYTKDAILARLKREVGHVVDIRNRVADVELDKEQVEEDFRTIIDLSTGIQIMTKALVEDFDMTEDEIKKTIGAKKMSLMQKAKLASKMAQFRMMRGGK